MTDTYFSNKVVSLLVNQTIAIRTDSVWFQIPFMHIVIVFSKDVISSGIIKSIRLHVIQLILIVSFNV